MKVSIKNRVRSLKNRKRKVEPKSKLAKKSRDKMAKARKNKSII